MTIGALDLYKRGMLKLLMPNRAMGGLDLGLGIKTLNTFLHTSYKIYEVGIVSISRYSSNH